jgi:hypothetical protein
MTVNLNRIAGLEEIETTALTTADATVIHTASSVFKRVIEMIVITNVDTANNCEVTLSWNDGSTDTTFWNKDVVALTTEIVEIPILTDGRGRVRSIKAEAEAANDINVTVVTSVQSRQDPGVGAPSSVR